MAVCLWLLWQQRYVAFRTVEKTTTFAVD